MNDDIRNEDVIDLRELMGVLLKKIWVLVFSAILIGGLAFGYTYTFIKPTYESSALMYVNNSNISIGSASFSISSSEITAAQELVDTYTVILKSRKVLNEVISQANLPYTYEQLVEMVDSTSVNNTQVFRVNVTTNDPRESEKIANTIAVVLPEKISDIVNGSDVRIVDYAVIPSKAVGPNYTKNAAIGALAGAAIAAFIIVLAHIFDDVIHSEDYLTNTYPDIPLLAVVPDMVHVSGNKYGYYGASENNSSDGGSKNGKK